MLRSVAGRALKSEEKDWGRLFSGGNSSRATCVGDAGVFEELLCLREPAWGSGNEKSKAGLRILAFDSGRHDGKEMWHIRKYWGNFLAYRSFSDNVNTKTYWDRKFRELGPEWRSEHYRNLLPFLPENEEFTLLEIGCGTGEGILLLSKLLPMGSYTACDFSEIAIAMAKRKNGPIEFYVHDVKKENIAGVYDYILLVEILEHLDDPFVIVDKCLKSSKRAVIIMVPLNPDGYSGPVRGDFKSSEHRYAFSRDTFSGKFRHETCGEFGDYIIFKVFR